jgi:hypothetical protein
MAEYMGWKTVSRVVGAKFFSDSWPYVCKTSSLDFTSGIVRRLTLAMTMGDS